MTRWWRSSSMARARRRSTMWSERCSAIGWPAWTRIRRRATGCMRCTTKATRLSLGFSRNIQEGAKTIDAAPEELEGLPADYIARHPAKNGEDGQERVTLTTDPPDMMPVMTFASERSAARAHVSRLQHARVSGEPANSARSAGHAAGDCQRARLPQLGRSGDSRPDDEVGGECARVFGQARRGQPRRRAARARAGAGVCAAAAAGACRDRYHEPRLLV